MLRFITVSLLITGWLPLLLAAEPARPNVLMIAVDDLNDWVGCLQGHPQVKTPHMDRLASRGTVFTNAHCQAPLCNPSRASLLTGLRPSTTGIYALQPGIRSVSALKQHVTLPQTFTLAGFHTFTCGKIYHDGSIAGPDRAREFGKWGAAPGMPRPPKKFVQTPDPHPLVDWGIFPDDDRLQADWQIADAAIAELKTLPSSKPFFVCVGFRLPHVPCYASQKWFDLYPAEGLQLPPFKADDRDDLPRFASYLHWKLPEPRQKFLAENDQWKPLVRAYLASISLMDSQIGRVLDALDATGRSSETVVVLWSDHGWHLGEKGITGKNTLWERSTRVPLIFAGPGIAAGARCDRPVELLDIFPTLLELSRFEPRGDLEGHSLVSLLKDATAERPWPAITTHNQHNHAVRSQRWRFIRYADGSEELYDLQSDPNEWTNLAMDSQYSEVRRQHAAWLPVKNAPPVPGSAHRLLTYENGVATWEAKVIDPQAPLPD